MGLEILEDLPDVDNILVCLGGGGLAAGVATVAKLAAEKRGKKIKVIAIQAEAGSGLSRVHCSRKAGCHKNVAHDRRRNRRG